MLHRSTKRDVHNSSLALNVVVEQKDKVMSPPLVLKRWLRDIRDSFRSEVVINVLHGSVAIAVSFIFRRTTNYRM